MTAIKTAVRWRKPTVLDEEVESLSAHYGQPVRRHYTLAADEYTRPYRFGRKGDRRAEVVFAIQDPGSSLWVHAKAHYPRHIFRLPSGGIHWHESVQGALVREIAEETALPVRIHSFLGLIEYRFVHEGQTADFASYVFLVQNKGGVPRPHASESITDFRPIRPGQLVQIAADLRDLLGDRRGWGQWRALAHDLVYEAHSDGRL